MAVEGIGKTLAIELRQILEQEYGGELNRLGRLRAEIDKLNRLLEEATRNPEYIGRALGYLRQLTASPEYKWAVRKGYIKPEEFKTLEESLEKAYTLYEELKEARRHWDDPDYLLRLAKTLEKQGYPDIARELRLRALYKLLEIYRLTGDTAVARRVAELAESMKGYEWLSWLVNPRITEADVYFILGKMGLQPAPAKLGYTCNTPICRYWAELPPDIKEQLKRYALARYLAGLLSSGRYIDFAELARKTNCCRDLVEAAAKAYKVSEEYARALEALEKILSSVRDAASAAEAATALDSLASRLGELYREAREAEAALQRYGVSLDLSGAVRELIRITEYAALAARGYSRLTTDIAGLKAAAANRDRKAVLEAFKRLTDHVLGAERLTTRIDCTKTPHFTGICRALQNWVGSIITEALETLYNVYTLVSTTYPALAREIYRLYKDTLNLPEPPRGRLGIAEDWYKELVSLLETYAEKMHRRAEAVKQPLETLRDMLASAGSYTLLYIIGLPLAAAQLARGEAGVLAALLRGNPGLAARLQKEILASMVPRNAEQLVGMALASIALGAIGKALTGVAERLPLRAPEALERVRGRVMEAVLEALDRSMEVLRRRIGEIRVAEPGELLESYTVALGPAKEALTKAIDEWLRTLPEEERLAVAEMVARELRNAMERRETLKSLAGRIEDEYKRIDQLYKATLDALKELDRAREWLEKGQTSNAKALVRTAARHLEEALRRGTHWPPEAFELAEAAREIARVARELETKGPRELARELPRLRAGLEALAAKLAKKYHSLATSVKKLVELVEDWEKQEWIRLMKEGKLRPEDYKLVPRDLEEELEIYQRLQTLEKLVKGKPGLEKLVERIRANIDHPAYARRLLAELEERIRKAGAEATARAAAAREATRVETPAGRYGGVIVAEKRLARIFRASPETLKRLAEEAGKTKEIRVYCCGREYIVERRIIIEPGRTRIEYYVRSGEDWARFVREYRLEDGTVYAVSRLEYDPEAPPETLYQMTESLRKGAAEDRPLAYIIDFAGERIPETIPVPGALPPLPPNSAERVEELLLGAGAVPGTINGWRGLVLPGGAAVVFLVPDELDTLLHSHRWRPATLKVDGITVRGYLVTDTTRRVFAIPVTSTPPEVPPPVPRPSGTVTAQKPSTTTETRGTPSTSTTPSPAPAPPPGGPRPAPALGPRSPVVILPYWVAGGTRGVRARYLREKLIL